MENDKNMEFEEDTEGLQDEAQPENAPRARNRTIMLTPEITGQVRARLAQELDNPPPSAPATSDGGFVPVSSRKLSAEGERRARSSYQNTPGMGPLPENRAYQPAPHASAQLPHKDVIVWNKPGMVVGFLVSYDVDKNGDVFVLRAGRLIVTSEPPANGNYLFINHDSVSPMHAIVRISEDGEIQVLDQLSEHGSIVQKFGTDEEVQLSGEKCSLEHGDLIRFGSRNFHVCVMPEMGR